MSFNNVGPGSWEGFNLNPKKADNNKSIQLQFDSQSINVSFNEVAQIAASLSEIAYSAGKTNNKKKMKEDVEETVWGALEEVKKNRDKKKRNTQ